MSNNEPSWAWLGLLKWSLQYSDGTAPTNTDNLQPMSAEDRAFLEKVIKESVIDPADRMKTLLAHLTTSLHHLSTSDSNDSSSSSNVKDVTTAEAKEETRTTTTTEPLDHDGILDALEELRDIVEQIDAARDFVKMNGLPFLLGCASQPQVPPEIRRACLGVLCTLSQNNPPVQQSLLDLDGLSVLASLYVAEEKGGDDDGKMRVMLIQALSCMVRGHAIGEESFCRSEYCRSLVANALKSEAPLKLRRKCTFFLKALVGSDGCTPQRVKDFEVCIRQVVNFMKDEDVELRETALGLWKRLLKKENDAIQELVMQERENIVGMGVARVKEIRELKGEAREDAEVEQELWEGILTDMAKMHLGGETGKKKEGEEGKKAAPLLIGR